MKIEVIDNCHFFISHPSTMVPTYPRGIGSAFHRAGAAGRGHRGHRDINDRLKVLHCRRPGEFSSGQLGSLSGKKYACLFFSLNGLPRHLLNDLIICTEKSFFEGSEGSSDPEP